MTGPNDTNNTNDTNNVLQVYQNYNNLSIWLRCFIGHIIILEGLISAGKQHWHNLIVTKPV